MSALPAVASAMAVLVAGSAVFLFPIGPISAHMLLHIALMNVLAPVAATILARGRLRPDRALLWTATIAQLLLLWVWHAPPAHRAAAGSTLISLVQFCSLFLTALAFWTSLITLPARNAWQGIFALLITGKFACLLGVLLVFAPRLLYGGDHADHLAGLHLLHDQQLAGLYMIAACPLSFVLAGVIMAAQAMNRFGRDAQSVAR